MSNFFVKLIKNPFVINLLLVIVVSCGVVYGVLAWLDSYTRHNQAVVVPDVKGMKLEDAAEFFGNNKLRYNVIDSVFSKDLAMGVELNGRTLLKGEHVPLTAHLVLKVSSGDPNMLPDSLALDSIPVEPLDSDIENWF